jgi:hypothetical protein
MTEGPPRVVMTIKPDVTGRDNYIIAWALAYAIECINRLPEEWQEASNQRDMELLLISLHGEAEAERCRTLARGHIERRGTVIKEGRIEVAPRDGDVVPIR